MEDAIILTEAEIHGVATELVNQLRHWDGDEHELASQLLVFTQLIARNDQGEMRGARLLLAALQDTEIRALSLRLRSLCNNTRPARLGRDTTRRRAS
jgi:hypothetical protein